MSEDRVAGGRGGGRATDLLVRPSKAVYRLIMDAPDLDSGGESPPPPEEENGDRRPEPDPFQVGLVGFMIGFCGVTAVRYITIAIKVMR